MTQITIMPEYQMDTGFPWIVGLPPLPDAAPHKEAVLKELERYVVAGHNPLPQCQPHSATGSYLRFDLSPFAPSPSLQFSIDGLVRVAYKNQESLQTNAVTQAEYALHLYSKAIHHPENVATYQKQFIQTVNALLTLEDGVTGAYRYPFAWHYYLIQQEFEAGWTSAMAQGEVLSALARSYHLTNNEIFKQAGNRALEYLLTPCPKGGVMSTLEDFAPHIPEFKEFIFFEEYVCKPYAYTLNGYISVLLGLYDWVQVTGCPKAQQAFTQGCCSLVLLLPYYDFGGMTAYDLGYLTHNVPPKFSAKYHKVHILLLHALHSIAPQYGFNRYEANWAAYPELYKAQRPSKPKKRWWKLNLSSLRPWLGLSSS